MEEMIRRQLFPRLREVRQGLWDHGEKRQENWVTDIVLNGFMKLLSDMYGSAVFIADCQLGDWWSRDGGRADEDLDILMHPKERGPSVDLSVVEVFIFPMYFNNHWKFVYVKFLPKGICQWILQDSMLSYLCEPDRVTSQFIAKVKIALQNRFGPKQFQRIEEFDSRSYLIHHLPSHTSTAYLLTPSSLALLHPGQPSIYNPIIILVEYGLG
jgi:hypothetical protein